MRGITSVVLATTNKTKIKELSPVFRDLGVHVFTLYDFPRVIDRIDEIGRTFKDNAFTKARVAANYTNHVAIGDDSGLEVEALGGEPGIYTSRYAQMHLGCKYDPERKIQQNRELLLKNMEAYQDPAQRKCRYVCAMAAVHPCRYEIVVQKTWEGELLKEELGESKLSFDPLFWDSVLKKSAAQMTAEEKNSVSHRGQALRELIVKLTEVIETQNYY